MTVAAVTSVICVGLRAAEGQLLDERVMWSYWCEPCGKGPPALALDEMTVYVQSGGTVVAVGRDGERRWQARTGVTGRRFVGPAVVGPDGTVFVRAWEGQASETNDTLRYFLYALSDGGVERWQAELPGVAPYPPGLGNERVWIGIENGTLAGYSFDGDGVVEVALSQAALQTVSTGSGGTAYVTSADGHLFAVTARGDVAWRHDVGVTGGNTIAIDDNGMLFVSDSQREPGEGDATTGVDTSSVNAYDAQGSQIWRVPLPDRTWHGSPILGHDGRIFLVEPHYPLSYGAIYAISEYGLVDAMLPIQRISMELVVAADSSLYLFGGTEDGRPELHVLDESLWAERWALQFPRSNYQSLTMDHQGVLYVVSDKYLYALRTESPGIADTPWPKTYGDVQNTSRARRAATVVTTQTSSQLPDGPMLVGSYPNPFNGTAVIWWSLPHEEFGSVSVYTLTGQRVAQLYEGKLPAGTRSLIWSATEAGSGLYVVRLETARGRGSTKVMVLR